MQNTTSYRWSLVSDAIGILIIGIELYWAVRWLVPADSRLTLYIFSFVVLAGVALYVWHKDPPIEHLSEPSEWAMAVVASILLAGVSFGIDMTIGLVNNPKLSPIEAGTKAGSPFGFPLTVMLCPGFTMLAIAGLVRALLPRSRATIKSQS